MRRPDQQPELRDTGHRHPPRQGMPGGGHIGRQPDHRGDRDDVEQNIGRGGGGKPLQPVQHAGHQGREADQDQIGKGDAGQIDRQREFLGRGRESWCQDQHDLGHEDLAQDRQEPQPEHHHGESLDREAARGHWSLCRQDAGKLRDEGGIEGAFPEQPAEQIGQLQRHEKCIGNRARAEHRRDHHVAHEAQDAASHGPAADGQNILEHGIV